MKRHHLATIQAILSIVCLGVFMDCSLSLFEGNDNPVAPLTGGDSDNTGLAALNILTGQQSVENGNNALAAAIPGYIPAYFKTQEGNGIGVFACVDFENLLTSLLSGNIEGAIAYDLLSTPPNSDGDIALELLLNPEGTYKCGIAYLESGKDPELVLTLPETIKGANAKLRVDLDAKGKFTVTVLEAADETAVFAQSLGLDDLDTPIGDIVNGQYKVTVTDKISKTEESTTIELLTEEIATDSTELPEIIIATLDSKNNIKEFDIGTVDIVDAQTFDINISKEVKSKFASCKQFEETVFTLRFAESTGGDFTASASTFTYYEGDRCPKSDSKVKTFTESGTYLGAAIHTFANVRVDTSQAINCNEVTVNLLTDLITVNAGDTAVEDPAPYLSDFGITLSSTGSQQGGGARRGSSSSARSKALVCSVTDDIVTCEVGTIESTGTVEKSVYGQTYFGSGFAGADDGIYYELSLTVEPDTAKGNNACAIDGSLYAANDRSTIDVIIASNVDDLVADADFYNIEVEEKEHDETSSGSNTCVVINNIVFEDWSSTDSTYTMPAPYASFNTSDVYTATVCTTTNDNQSVISSIEFKSDCDGTSFTYTPDTTKYTPNDYSYSYGSTDYTSLEASRYEYDDCNSVSDYINFYEYDYGSYKETNLSGYYYNADYCNSSSSYSYSDYVSLSFYNDTGGYSGKSCSSATTSGGTIPSSGGGDIVTVSTSPADYPEYSDTSAPEHSDTSASSVQANNSDSTSGDEFVTLTAQFTTNNFYQSYYDFNTHNSNNSSANFSEEENQLFFGQDTTPTSLTISLAYKPDEIKDFTVVDKDGNSIFPLDDNDKLTYYSNYYSGSSWELYEYDYDRGTSRSIYIYENKNYYYDYETNASRYDCDSLSISIYFNSNTSNESKSWSYYDYIPLNCN